MPPALVHDTSYAHYLHARQAVENAAVQALTPTHDQQIILYIIAGYVAAILLLWNMPVAKIILSPFKVHIRAYHLMIASNILTQLHFCTALDGRSSRVLTRRGWLCDLRQDRVHRNRSRRGWGHPHGKPLDSRFP